MTATTASRTTATRFHSRLSGILAAAAVLFVCVPLPSRSAPVLIDSLGLAACTATALALRLPPAIRTLLYIDAVYALSLAGGRLGWGTPATTTAVVVVPVLALKLADRAPSLRPTLPWLTRGRPTRGDLALMLAVVALSVLALTLWAALAKPKAPAYLENLHHGSKIVLVLGVLGFALVNPLWEEAFFRGVVLTELAQLWCAPSALGFQAVTFGLAHLNGFPSGAVGACLAGSWGLALGVIRLRTRGLLWPYIAHVCADTAIAVIAIAMLH